MVNFVMSTMAATSAPVFLPKCSNEGRSLRILPETEDILENDYFLEDIIGRGTFGVVRKGVHRITGHIVAVKIVSKSNLSKPNDVDLLTQEVEILQSLSGHGNIVELLKVYEDDDALYLVMELCEGGDLLEVLNSPALAAAGGFSESEAAEIFYQIVAAVARCAESGVIHRDVKPENVLFVKPFTFDERAGKNRGYPTVTDNCAKFGNFCRQLEEIDSAGGRKESFLHSSPILQENKEEFLTKSVKRNTSAVGGVRGMGVRRRLSVKLGDWGLAVKVRNGELLKGMAGSDPYLCPEMILEKLYSTESDVWSLGCLLFILLSRRLPFGVAGHSLAVKDGCQTSTCGETSRVKNGDALKSDENELFRNICEGKLDFKSPPWLSISNEAKDLVSKMLSVDKASRPKAWEILTHPWMRNARATTHPNLGSTGILEIPSSAVSRRLSYDNLLSVSSCSDVLSQKVVTVTGSKSAGMLNSPKPLSNPLDSSVPSAATKRTDDLSASHDSAILLASCRGLSTPVLKNSPVSRLGTALRLNDFSLNYRYTLQA